MSDEKESVSSGKATSPTTKEREPLLPSTSNERDPILPKYYKADMAEGDTSMRKKSMNGPWRSGGSLFCILLLLLVLLVFVVIGLSVGLGTYYGLKSSSSKQDLPDSINRDDLKQLLIGLENTAVRNSRSVLTGFNNSAEYVIETLRANGYTDIRKQHFSIPVPQDDEGTFTAQVTFSEDSALDLEFPQYNQFQIMIYSAGCNASNDINLCTWDLISLIDNDESAEYGCNSPSLDITNRAVLVPYDTDRGNCTIYEKAETLNGAGAAAVIFVSDGTSTAPPRNRVFQRNDDGTVSYVDILSIGVTNATGNQLLQFLNTGTGQVRVTLELSASVVIAYTYNVFTETESGRSDNTVMIGSHLDSVPAGPGSNDDGSGSMANLIIATQIAKLGIQPVNKVRFAWWGAEELGLLGSRFYVASLTDQQKDDIRLYLNFDMVASTNFQRGIYSAESAGDDEDLIRACLVIQKYFEDYFNLKEKTWELVPFTGGSDYRPFLDALIPAGGLFTGAGSIKTEEQYRKFGGIVNAPLDPCYHQLCDSVEVNIDYDVYELMSRAAAYTLEKLMNEENLEDLLNTYTTMSGQLRNNQRNYISDTGPCGG